MPGFLARMENDVLRFEPTVATTCYGMNDHGYQPFQQDLANVYREAFKAIAAEVSGGKVPQGDFPTVDDGVIGMAFIQAVVASSKSSAKWTRFPAVPG